MRYLALDLGERRIGVAISDTLGMIARPLAVFERASRVEDFARVAAWVEEHAVDAVVVGIPFNMDGSASRQTSWVQDYSAALAATLPVPVHLWDERLTTEEAGDIIRAQGRRPGKDWIDAVAAAVILQSYLDAHPLTDIRTS